MCTDDSSYICYQNKSKCKRIHIKENHVCIVWKWHLPNRRDNPAYMHHNADYLFEWTTKDCGNAHTKMNENETSKRKTNILKDIAAMLRPYLFIVHFLKSSFIHRAFFSLHFAWFAFSFCSFVDVDASLQTQFISLESHEFSIELWINSMLFAFIYCM